MSARVVCRIRTGVTVSFEIGEKPAFMGRDKAAAVSVPVEGVSRHHARISWDGKSHWLEDLKSTNGTFLNGRAITRERLYHLDVITLGKKLDLVFLQQEVAAAAQKVKGIVRAALTREAGDAPPHEIARGEVTIGRAQACNIVADAAAASKVHARIERTRDQLVIEDLGSANGTFVNGLRVMSAFLNDGDVVSLGGVESYKVTIEMGEIQGASGRFSAPTATTNTASRPRFSADWKTRYDWSTTEQNELADLRERLAEEDKVRQEQRTRRNPVVVVRPSAKEATITPKGPAPAAAKPEKPAAAAPVAKPGAAPVPTGARTAPPPATPPKAPTPVPSPPSAPKAAPPSPPPAATPSPPVVATPPSPPPAVAAPAAPAPKPAVTPPAPVAPAPPVTPPSPRVTVSPPTVAPATPRTGPAGPILEVRLSATGIELVVNEPGAHDLGRSSEMELRVSHPTVSRRHARIILSDDRAMVYVQDQGGANGTRLNGKEVAKLAPLSEGDKVGVGDLELKVSLKRGS